MSTRYNNGSHYENHQRAAELHDLAAHAHRSAAQQHGKQDHMTGHEHSREALEHSEEAFLHSQQTHENATHEHGVTSFGHQEISARAHELWQARGGPDGSPEEDWFEAAKQLRAQKEKLIAQAQSRKSDPA